MNTATNPNSASSRLNTLEKIRREVNLLRSFAISMIGEDKEGKYNPKFSSEILKATKEKPTQSFRDSRSFLDEIRKA